MLDSEVWLKPPAGQRFHALAALPPQCSHYTSLLLAFSSRTEASPSFSETTAVGSKALSQQPATGCPGSVRATCELEPCSSYRRGPSGSKGVQCSWIQQENCSPGSAFQQV
ncbi:hypothetical protein EK904_013458 [Melospiza melodia maxima]|nr:hypothetical protein EK904_013458 [Melospiza melodia maxima]